MSHLTADCLNEIFEYFENDIVTLHSCLLVNRLWCELSVRILWKDVRNYSPLNYVTLISCLPNKSKEILYKNGFIISSPNSKPPVFNYAKFCKILSIWQIKHDIKQLLATQKSISLQNLNNNTYIVEQEIYKLFINQISSLKVLDYSSGNIQNINIINIISSLGAKGCLNNLSELDCCSNTCPEFFYQLSKICHKIQTLNIRFEEVISNGLTDLISVQQDLKYMTIYQFYDHYRELSLKLPNTLIKLELIGECYKQLSFITSLTNLQELELSFDDFYDFDYKALQYATFSQLQVLKIQDACPYVPLIKFLENNGKNLKEFYVGDNEPANNNSLNLAIAKFCTNLIKLSTGFKNNESETLKMIFNSCQYLESIKIWCGREFLKEKDAFELVVKYSPKHVYELILHYPYIVKTELHPEELESFFFSWSNHKQKKSLTLMISKNNAYSFYADVVNMKIIEKYIKLGVVKKFKVIEFNICHIVA